LVYRIIIKGELKMIRNYFFKKLKIKKMSLAACITSALVALFAISYNLGERYYMKQAAEKMDKSVFRVTYTSPVDYKDEIIIYDTMHRMANSRIVAEDKDISGKLQVTKRQIEAVRIIVKQMNYPDNSYIIGILDRWEKGDFSLVNDEHNYFYNRLTEGSDSIKPKN
jgi:hypothetical protein